MSINIQKFSFKLYERFFQLKKMTSQNEQKLSNFWIGFSLGVCTLMGGGYLFGTKRGREYVKKMLRFSENIEANLEKMIEKVDKQTSKKDSKSGLSALENIEGILGKIKQVTNHS